MEWYDELLRFTDTPIVRLNRAVAVGEADGALAGLAALAEVDQYVPRREAVAAYLHERNGDLELAARLYANAVATPPTSQNATIRLDRQRDSTSICHTTDDLGLGRRSSAADLLRQVVGLADLADQLELGLEPVGMLLLAGQNGLGDLSAPVVAQLHA